MREDKVLLVTGASSDIGCALIRRLADDYGTVWAHYRSSDALERLAQEGGGKIRPIQADFSDADSVKQMAGRIRESGRCPDHIVHLPAPRTSNQRFHKCTWEEYQAGIDVSLRSAVLLLREFLPYMAGQHYGKVVFMLTAYVLGGIPPKYQSPYITVKYALYGLMRNLASEYAEKGITVNGVSPDMMETKFLEDIPELIIRQNAERSPLGRNLTVEDVVPAFAYLLSDGADAVTGQNLGVTGGGR